MYEDSRTIERSGILSRAGAKSFVPKPINISMNNATKPAQDHVNPDKVYQAQLAYQKKQMDMQQEQQKQAAEGGGMSVICTRYNQLGYMDDATYMAECEYGDWLFICTRGFMQWYWSWAGYVVKAMHGKTLASRLLIKSLWPLVKAWSKYSLTGKGWLGEIIHKTAFAIYRRSRFSK